MKMTPEEFKKRWESDERGGGISNNDCADCAVAWGLTCTPRIMPIKAVVDMVCKYAKVEDDK